MADKVEVIILATDKASTPIKGIRGALGGLGGALSTAAKGFAVIGAAAAAGFAMMVKSSIGVNAQLETTTLQFKTLMGSAEEAEKHVASLFKFAEKTPFETGPIIEASLKLQTFGGAALNTEANLILLGDAAAAVGAPIDELGFWVGRLYSNLQAGQPFGEAAMRLQELAVMSPQARQQMEALQKAGADASVIFGVLQEDLGRFTGAMEEQAGTWEGMVSTIKDQISLLLADALKPFFTNAKDGMSELIKLLNDPDIVAGIKAMGAEVGKAADAFFQLTGGVIRLFSALGQEAANERLFKDLNISLEESRQLIYEIQEQLGVGLWMTTEEQLAVAAEVNRVLKERYATEIGLLAVQRQSVDITDGQLAAWASVIQATDNTATSIQNVTSEVFKWRVESVLMGESTKTLADHAKILGDGLAPLTEHVSNNVRELNAAGEAATRLAGAFANLAGDYITELPAAMEPLITTIDGVAGAQSNLAVNADGARQAIFDQLLEMEAGPDVIANYGLAVGIMTREQAIAAIAATLLKDEIGKMAKLIAEGVPVETVLADFDALVNKINNELIPAAMDAAGQVPAHFQDMIGPVSGAAVDIGGALMSGMVDGINAGVPEATRTADDAADAVIRTTKNKYGVESPSTVFAGIGRDLMEGLSQGIAGLVQRLVSEMITFGRNLINGLIAGINAVGMNILAALGDWVQAAIDYAKRLLGISSPSRVFYEVGLEIGEGLIGGIRDKGGEVLDTIGDLMSSIGKVSGLAGAFGNIFKDRNITPVENALKAIGEQITGTTEGLESELSIFGKMWNEPGLREFLQGKLSTAAFGSQEWIAATRALAMYDRRIELMRQQARLQEELAAGQNRLLLLESQRQQINFLQQQFELLKLIRENNLGSELLAGIEFGINADPAALMNAMIAALQRLITAAQQEIDTSPLTGQDSSPLSSRSLGDEFFSRAGGGGGNGMVVNIDARGSGQGAGTEIERVVRQVMREYGVKADIRMRTG